MQTQTNTAAGDEVEITPEMTEAGEAVLCRMTNYFGADEACWAERVYRAMRAAAVHNGREIRR